MNEELNISQVKVLKTLATDSDKWFTFQEIVRLSGVNRLNVERAINTLRERDYLFVIYDGLVQISPDGESVVY